MAVLFTDKTTAEKTVIREQFCLPWQRKDQAVKCRYWTDADSGTTYHRQLPTDQRQAAVYEDQENTACHLVIAKKHLISDRLILGINSTSKLTEQMLNTK